MRIDQVNWPAVRAFRRAYAPIAEARAEAEEADAGFDAGEFSGPCHANYAQDEYGACLGRVADAFGVSPEALDEMICIDFDHALRCLIAAQEG